MTSPAEPLLSAKTLFDPRLDFDKEALKVFRRQSEYNAVYRNYLDTIRIRPEDVKSPEDIPFLPIQFFKSKRIVTGHAPGDHTATEFTSSGTTAGGKSVHVVADMALYAASLLAGFRFFYGDPAQYNFLLLIPPELRGGSSLIFMADTLLNASRQPLSGYYSGKSGKLAEVMHQLAGVNERYLLFGLTWALMDFSEFILKRTGGRGLAAGPRAILMETGGMKGRRRELVRDEVHQVLQRTFGVDSIHSEYGMTELLSQAYSQGKGIFRCPPWMKAGIRDLNDPLAPAKTGATGGINVTDLANVHSCAFVATEDLGRQYEDGSFGVLGRIDYSDMRGCNLMMEGF